MPTPPPRACTIFQGTRLADLRALHLPAIAFLGFAGALGCLLMAILRYGSYALAGGDDPILARGAAVSVACALMAAWGVGDAFNGHSRRAGIYLGGVAGLQAAVVWFTLTLFGSTAYVEGMVVVVILVIAALLTWLPGLAHRPTSQLD